MAIPCNELQQTINFLMASFQPCTQIRASDLKLLLDLMVSLSECSSGGSSPILNHNSLLGLQPIDNEDYYHLSQEQYDYLSSLVTNDDIQDIRDDINLLAPIPVYIQPETFITDITSTNESGTSINVNITQDFIQNDAGVLINRSIIKNGITVSTNGSFNETVILPLGTITYLGNANYSQGLCKNNIIGNQNCTGRIEAGNINSNNVILTGISRLFAGSVDVFPVNNTEVRSKLLSQSVVTNSNSLVFTTGTVNRRFVIAIPNNKTLVSAINSGTNERLNFTLDNTITTVPDAGGTNITYKIYKLENAVPFSNNYTINIILQ